MASTTNTVIMVRPTNFCCNMQTITNNYYQKVTIDDVDGPADDTAARLDINTRAQQEFDGLVAELRNVGVNVVVIQDPREDTPDSIFPNNHIFFASTGIAKCPMYAPNRRLERELHPTMIQQLEAQGFFIPTNTFDYTYVENTANPTFLESTGCIVADRENKAFFAALSPRCDETLAKQFANDFGFEKVILFKAYQTCDNERRLIYHTNVMMSVSRQFAIVALSTIDDVVERKNVVDTLEALGKEVIDISEDQVNNFLGNALQVQNTNGEEFLVMSTTAYKALTEVQKTTIEKYCKIVHSHIPVIEALGGGSARCMLLEVFLDKKVE